MEGGGRLGGGGGRGLGEGRHAVEGNCIATCYMAAENWLGTFILRFLHWAQPFRDFGWLFREVMANPA